MDEIPVSRSNQQKNALLHLVHPDRFESIVSQEAKERIAERFSSLVDEPTAHLDRRLWLIRQKLAEDHEQDFSFFDEAIRRQWEADSSRWGQFIQWARRFYEMDIFDADERDSKILVCKRLQEARTSMEKGNKKWRELLSHALKRKPNNMTPWQVHDKFLTWVDSAEGAARDALSTIWDDQLNIDDRIGGFLKQLPTTVISGPGGRLNLASVLHMIMDPYSYPPYRVTAFEKAHQLVGARMPSATTEVEAYEHALAFLDLLSQEAARRGLELRDRLDAQSVLWWVTKHDGGEPLTTEEQRAYAEFLGATPTKDETDEEGIEGVAEPSKPSLDELAEHLLFGPEYLHRIDRLLRSKRQVIFHGPPGTGKTYVAQELAKHYATAPDAVTVVQFHPSYAYEDFVEGFRPKLFETRPGFDLKPGPLKLIARRAVQNPQEQFILLIDEINRGNLAKIFGELYFLLEYRDQEIRLQYSDEPFSLPKNLWIIATMNTADRSIALVDSALRRRFHFVPFFPDEPPVQGLLARWLKRTRPELQWLADVVDLANKRLDNRHTAIGPSYFLRSDLDTAWIDLIWSHSILPYLEEQFFGEEGRLEDFDLGRLRTEAQRAQETPDDNP